MQSYNILSRIETSLSSAKVIIRELSHFPRKFKILEIIAILAIFKAMSALEGESYSYIECIDSK